MKRAVLVILYLLIGISVLVYSSTREQTELPGNIKTLIKNNCSLSGCHQGKYPAANLNFEPDKFLASVVNTPSLGVPDKKIVDISSPEKSYLLDKVKGEPGIAGKRMPINRPPLTEEQVRAIETWIYSLGDKPSPPSPGDEGALHNDNGSSLSSAQAAPGQKRGFSIPAFWGTRLANLPTAQTLGKGEFLFRISHRFQQPLSSGWDSFYGLDGPAFILFSFGYGLTDNLMVTIGRSKLYQEWELYADWLLLEQGKKSNLPLAAALHVGGSLVTQDEPAGADWSGRFRLSALLSFSYQVSNRFSVLVVPGYASNTNFWEAASEGTFSLGIGGRFMVFRDISFIAEWIPVLAGYMDSRSAWGIGLERKIGGHVFQFFITNSIGLTASQFLPGGDLRLEDGDFRLGFNIFRTF